MGIPNNLLRGTRQRRENIQNFLDGRTNPNICLGGKPLTVLQHTDFEPVPTVDDLSGNILYRFYNARMKLLYIGMTKNLLLRCNGCRKWQPGSAHRTRTWWPEVCLVTIETGDSREALAQMETRAIQNESPLHNIVDQFRSRGITVSYRNGLRVLGETL